MEVSGRLRVLADGEVVETDERNIFAGLKAARGEGLQGADGGHVVTTQNGGGRLGKAEQKAHALRAAIPGVIAFGHNSLSKVWPVAFMAFAQCVKAPCACCSSRKASAQIADALMPEVDKVLDGVFLKPGR